MNSYRTFKIPSDGETTGRFTSVPEEYADWCEKMIGEGTNGHLQPVNAIIQALKTMIAVESLMA
jgi:hypothetical protein